MQAYETGCKGCTTYRPNAVTGSVLAVSEEKDAAETPVREAPPSDGEVIYIAEPLDRPQALEGNTY